MPRARSPARSRARSWSPREDPRYAEVEESVAFTLQFPSGVMANGMASYGAHEQKDLRIHLERATIDQRRAFAYEGQGLHVAHRSGSVEAIEERRIGAENAFALEIDHMAQCVHSGRMPRTPGEEGRQDHLVMEAIYRSVETGAPVRLEAPFQRDATCGPGPDEEG